MTFFTYCDAMQFHNHMNDMGIKNKMRSVPRKLSSSCGVCVFFEVESLPDDLTLGGQIEVDKLYTLSDNKDFQELPV